MFESNYTCHFFRLWGYEEGKKNIPLQDALLGNMQNDFDAKLGDVCAEIGSRYFIIEFKTNREGFRKEVSPSGKVHRAHLYQHLKNDSFCRSIARQGHFGAYADPKHQLVFEPYAQCSEEVKTKDKIVAERLDNNPEPWNELNYQAWVADFGNFYKSITEANLDFSELNPGFFAHGLGITKDHLEEYIQCMYEHLHSVEVDTGETILGAFSPSNGKFVAFKGSISELVNRLHSFFDEMKSSQTYGLTSRPTGPRA